MTPFRQSLAVLVATLAIVHGAPSARKVKSFQVCMNNPQGLGADVVKAASVPVFSCADVTASTVVGTYCYMCGPVPSNMSHATSTQHLIIGENAIFYATLFDLATYSFDFPTVLSTTGHFPKPASFRSLAYESRMNTQVPTKYDAMITVVYKNKEWNPLA